MSTASLVNQVTSSTPSSPEPAPHAFQDSFDATAAARAALAPEALRAITLDVQTAWPLVTGAVPHLNSLRGVIEKLPDFDLAQFNQLQTFAEALGYAQADYQVASEPVEDLPALLARALVIRDLLTSDANALAKRGLVDGKRLGELKGGPGYLNAAADLEMLTRLLRERWSEVSARSGVQAADLDEAEDVAKKIALGWGARAQQVVVLGKAAEVRQRAYTLMVNAYDEARRAALYVRWKQNDGDKFAPSLYAGRTGAKSTGSSVSNTGDGAAPAGGPSAPAAAGATKPGATPPATTGGTPVATSPAVPVPYHPEPHPAAPLPAGGGLPGGSPFGS